MGDKGHLSIESYDVAAAGAALRRALAISQILFLIIDCGVQPPVASHQDKQEYSRLLAPDTRLRVFAEQAAAGSAGTTTTTRLGDTCPLLTPRQTSIV